jgi:hypothetical protein
MSLRFRRRARLGSGLTLNIGKRGPSSLRVGPRGLGLSVGRRGIVATVSLLGTGLGYVFRRKR